jgi:hypothetical protein
MKRKLRNRNSVDGRWFISRWLKDYGLWTIVISLLVFACSSKETSSIETYTCPMHPTVEANRPGSCPVCGMDLVRKAKAGEEVTMTKELNQLIKSPNRIITTSIKTMRAEYKSLPITSELFGIVTYDTRSIYVIPTRIGGRLEKVFLKYNFQPVTKGMKIAELYSPELLSAQRELLFLVQNDSDNKALIDGAISRLKFLGATEKQVTDLMNNQKVTSTFTIYSPYEGYLTLDDQLPELQPSPLSSTIKSSGGMGMSSATVSANQLTNFSKSLPREGSYVETGQALFKIVSSTATWIEFELPAADAQTIKKGDEIQLIFKNEKNKAKVDFIDPFTERLEDFVRIRTYYKSNTLLIGQLVKGVINLSSKSSLWLPTSAVLDLGLDQVVFIKEQNQFSAKKVQVGLRANNSFEITSGLTSGDEVAIDAHYLVDSEGFVKVTK